MLKNIAVRVRISFEEVSEKLTKLFITFEVRLLRRDVNILQQYEVRV